MEPGDPSSSIWIDAGSENHKLLAEEQYQKDGFDDEAEVDIDEALTLAGSFGLFQFLTIIGLMLLVLSIAFHFVLSVFIGASPSWYCTSNTTAFCRQHYGRHIASGTDLFKQRCLLHRHEWEYTTDSDYSFVTEYDLVCEKTYVAALASSAVYIGGIIGSLVSGSASDVYGRKPVLLTSLAVTFVASLLCAYITAMWQLILIRSVLGAATVAAYFTGYVLLAEFVTPACRSMTSNVYVMSMTFSHLSIDLWAYYERRWRYLQCRCSFICVAAFCVLYFMPESPRFLLAKKKIDSATEIIRKIAAINRKDLFNVHLKLPLSGKETDDKYSYLDLLKRCKVLWITVCIGLQWTTIGLLYYGLALESESIGGDMYKTFALTVCADLPSYFISAYTCNRFGRKKSNLTSLFIAGLLIGALAVIPQYVSWRYSVNMTIVMIAKVFTENAFNGIYTWSFEIFPTVLRSQGISVCVIFQRIGLLLVPFITTLLAEVRYFLPFVFMALLAMCACACGLVLPETNKKPTREVYDDFLDKKKQSGGYGAIESYVKD